jgi:DNA modification methylase
MSQDIESQAGSDRVPGKTNGPMKAVLKRSGNKERKAASERGIPVASNGSTNGAVAGSIPWEGSTRNKRSVWTVTTKPCPEAAGHFATFPPDLIAPCVLAGSPRGGVVLDPFMGAGTTALVAAKYDRRFIGCELNPEYIKIAEARVASETAQGKLL